MSDTTGGLLATVVMALATLAHLRPKQGGDPEVLAALERIEGLLQAMQDREPPPDHWRMRNGELIAISQMSENHLRNALRYTMPGTPERDRLELELRRRGLFTKPTDHFVRYMHYPQSDEPQP